MPFSGFLISYVRNGSCFKKKTIKVYNIPAIKYKLEIAELSINNIHSTMNGLSSHA